MIIERDLPVTMDDGVILRADVYRPDTTEKVPVIMTMGPYGKGVSFQEHYKPMWDALQREYPDLLAGSQKRWLTWETVDPELWVDWGYAVIRVDSRGAGRSPGYLDVFSPRETRDFYDLIEWAGVQAWSSGKVGLNGISYYALNQWNVASLQPPHLTAMIPWEGAGDMYRDAMRHGGILSNEFFGTWFPRQVKAVQHGNPAAHFDNWLGESSAGPETLPEDELEDNRGDLLANTKAREMDGEWYRARSADWSKVVVPFLSAASLAGFGLHPRGNFEAFTRAASTQKWLECHPGKHEEWFYIDYGLKLQRRFFDHFLKGEANGWDQEPRVLLNLRRPFEDQFESRKEDQWPLAGTDWKKLFLNAESGSLDWDSPAAKATHTFEALGDGVRWLTPPLAEETEITGPMALRLWMSSSTSDADFFVTFMAFSPDDREVTFQGTLDPKTPLAQGWLRASHRKLCPTRSEPHQPYHTHDDKQPLRPGREYALDIEILPTSIILPAGFRIALDIRGIDFERPGGDTYGSFRTRGSGPFIHTDPQDRPENVAGGKTTLLTGPGRESYLLIPVIPKDRG